MRKRPPLSPTDKLCFAALAGILIATVTINTAMDEAAYQAAEQVDKPMSVVTEQAITYAEFLAARQEAMEAVQEPVEEAPADWYREDVPLDQSCQLALMEACEDNGVPVSLALGLIEVESNFDPMAENGGSYGLCQLNKKYWPEGLTPEGNITCGISYLGELLEQYEDTAAALTAYNAGSDTGDRTYANAVLAAAEKWKED